MATALTSTVARWMASLSRGGLRGQSVDFTSRWCGTGKHFTLHDVQPPDPPGRPAETSRRALPYHCAWRIEWRRIELVVGWARLGYTPATSILTTPLEPPNVGRWRRASERHGPRASHDAQLGHGRLSMGPAALAITSTRSSLRLRAQVRSGRAAVSPEPTPDTILVAPAAALEHKRPLNVRYYCSDDVPRSTGESLRSRRLRVRAHLESINRSLRSSTWRK